MCHIYICGPTLDKNIIKWVLGSPKYLVAHKMARGNKIPVLAQLVYAKRLHQTKTWSIGREGKGLDSQLCHYWELRTWESAGVSRLKAPSGGWKVPARWRLQPGLKFWSPPQNPRRRCSELFNLNWWKGYCYLLIMAPRVEAMGTHPFRSTPTTTSKI